MKFAMLESMAMIDCQSAVAQQCVLRCRSRLLGIVLGEMIRQPKPYQLVQTGELEMISIRYRIRRMSDGFYWCGDAEFAPKHYKPIVSAAAAGTILAELPNGMADGTYRLEEIPERKEMK